MKRACRLDTSTEFCPLEVGIRDMTSGGTARAARERSEDRIRDDIESFAFRRCVAIAFELMGSLHSKTSMRCAMRPPTPNQLRTNYESEDEYEYDYDYEYEYKINFVAYLDR